MKKEVTPELEATVRFLPTSEGGRQGATPVDFFGCLFEYRGEYFDCWLLLEKVGSVHPGQVVAVPIKLLSPQLLIGDIKVGASFNLREGGQKIAEGEIKRILRADDRPHL
jgi:translation elongation factor EF-Tu-like GTPase